MRSDRLKALSVPRTVDVELDAEGTPLAVRRKGDRLVVASIGDTWRLDDEWWRRQIARRYVEVILEGGGRTVLFEDLVTGEWFVHQ